MLWGENRGKWKGRSRQESNPGHLRFEPPVLCHWAMTTTNPHNFLYVPFTSYSCSSQSRELKSVNLDASGQLIKLVLHQNHINRLNLFNQVRWSLYTECLSIADTHGTQTMCLVSLVYDTASWSDLLDCLIFLITPRFFFPPSFSSSSSPLPRQVGLVALNIIADVPGDVVSEGEGIPPHLTHYVARQPKEVSRESQGMMN